MEKGISMIMPAYNAEKYLDLSIGSVLAQTYKDFELIIVDDGSKDNTWEICKRYAEKDCRVKAFHKENEGVSLARNYALDKVGKEYVMFIDADDYIDATFMQRHIEVAEKGYDCVVSGFYMKNRDAFIKDHNCRPEKISAWKEDIDAPNFKILCDKFTSMDKIPSYLSPAWNKLFKTSIIKDNNLRFIQIIIEDHVFCYEYMKYINSCYVLNWAGYFFIHNTDEHIGSSHKCISEYMDIQLMMSQYDYLIKRFNIIDRKYLNNIRWRYLNRIKSLAFKGYFPESYKSHKERIDVWNTIVNDEIVKNTTVSFMRKIFHDKQISFVLFLAHTKLFYLADPFIRLMVKIKK